MLTKKPKQYNSKTKSIIVTGGSRGIGYTIAQTLLQDGYHVHIIGKDAKRLSRARKNLATHGAVTSIVCDLGNPQEVDAFIASWKEPLYGIVHNAGICKTQHLRESESEKDTVWDEVLQTNLIAPYRLTKGLHARIVDGGRIVLISSQLGKEGRAGYSAYCASKFALIGLTKCWAKELGMRGITVNAVCPGWVRTDMSIIDTKRLAEERGIPTEQLYKEICKPLELKRFTEPEEVAHLVAFLVSQKASGITGRDILLNTIWNQE